MDIVRRMLDARKVYLISGRPMIDMVCLLPPDAHVEWLGWIQIIEGDPFIGHVNTRLSGHAFGMDIRCNEASTDIEVTNENHQTVK